jgi:hypothetical protein
MPASIGLDGVALIDPLLIDPCPASIKTLFIFYSFSRHPLHTVRRL